MADSKDNTLPPEVAAFLDFKRSGDYIPHSWVKHIGVEHETKRKGQTVKAWRSRPHAQRLLARVVWAYSPTPVKNGSGDVTRWKKKFAGSYWVLNTREMCEALGCSRATLVAELGLLKGLGLVTTRPITEGATATTKPGAPIYVIPVAEEIKRISAPEQPVKKLDRSKPVKKLDRVNRETCKESLQQPVKKLDTSYIPSSPPILTRGPSPEGGPDTPQNGAASPKGKPTGDPLELSFNRLQLSPEVRALTNAIPEDAIREFAIEIQRATGLKIRKIKDWVTGSREAYEAAEGKPGLIAVAVARMRKGQRTIADPYSLVNVLASLAAETRTEAKAEATAGAMVQIETAGGSYFVAPEEVRAFCAERGLPVPEGTP